MHGELGALAHTLLPPPTISLSLWDEPELPPGALTQTSIPHPAALYLRWQPSHLGWQTGVGDPHSATNLCSQWGPGHELGHSEVQVCVSGKRIVAAVPILATDNLAGVSPSPTSNPGTKHFPAWRLQSIRGHQFSMSWDFGTERREGWFS